MEKPIKDYELYYVVHSSGKIWSNITNRFIIGRTNKKGYTTISLKGKPFSLHRIVALSFIPNHENKTQVNHINGVKSDNRVENLEWCTVLENNIHAINNGLRKGKKSKGVIQKDKNGNEVARYFSIKNTIGFNIKNIRLVCNNKRKLHKGFKWEYIN